MSPQIWPSYLLTSRFSDEMRALHEAMEDVRREKEKMQESLRKRYGMSTRPSSHAGQQLIISDTQSLILTKGTRFGYHILLSKRSDFSKLDKTRKFQGISEAKTVKAYAYSVSRPGQRTRELTMPGMVRLGSAQ